MLKKLLNVMKKLPKYTIKKNKVMKHFKIVKNNINLV